MWMTRGPVTIGHDTPLAEIARLMTDNAIRRLPVVSQRNGEQRLEGIVSATDVYRAMPPHRNPFAALSDGFDAKVTAERIMTAAVLTCTPETPIEDAATLMRDRKIGAMPVVRDGRLVGIITESDIFKAFISILKGEPHGLRVTFSVTENEDVLSLLTERIKDRAIQIQSVMSSRRDNVCTCVIHMTGPDAERLIDDLWKLGHQVINVLRT